MAKVDTPNPPALIWYLRYIEPEEKWKGKSTSFVLESTTPCLKWQAELEKGFIRHCPEIVGEPTPEQWTQIMIEVSEHEMFLLDD
jgi:hypothetical protein